MKKGKNDGETVEKEEGDERSIKTVYDTIMMRSSLLPITGRQMLVVHKTVQTMYKGRSPRCFYVYRFIIANHPRVTLSIKRIHCD